MQDSAIYEPSHIANYFLKKAHAEDIDVTQLKLLKLVYIGYGWVQAILDRPLFEDDIEAWPHGPVVPSLYNEFKHFGRKPITSLATEFDLDSLELEVPEIATADKNANLVLGKVWDVYYRYSASALRNKTHEANTPWTITYDDGRGRGSEIPPKLIKDHFKKRIAEYVEAAK